MPEAVTEKQHITLNVYDEKIDVYVKPEEEQYYRLAEKVISATYNKYAQVFKGRRSDHTIALLTLVEIGLKYEKEKAKNDTATYNNTLEKLSSEIDVLLDEKKK